MIITISNWYFGKNSLNIVFEVDDSSNKGKGRFEESHPFIKLLNFRQVRLLFTHNEENLWILINKGEGFPISGNDAHGGEPVDGVADGFEAAAFVEEEEALVVEGLRQELHPPLDVRLEEELRWFHLLQERQGHPVALHEGQNQRA